MILFEDPVVYEWQHIATKALVIGGADDRLVSDYPRLARKVASQLQNAQMIIYPEVGHSPHLDNPEEFHPDLIEFLKCDPDEPADQGWRAVGTGNPNG